MRTPAAIFPFCAELLPVVKYFDRFQDEFLLVKLIAPRGLGLSGKDAGYSRNQPDLGISVSDDYDMNDSSWRALILTRTLDDSIIDDDGLSDAMECALLAGKSVFYFDDTESKVPARIRELRESYSSLVTLCVEDTPISKLNNPIQHFSALKSPVVLAGGLLSEADVFETVICLANRFVDSGYRPLTISRHPIGRLFGFRCVSNIIYAKVLTESQKIYSLNMSLQVLEHFTSPDCFIIEAPDAVMQYNSNAQNGFGILTYMLCQAAHPDYFICGVPYEIAIGSLLASLSDEFSNRLGAPLFAVHASNIVVDLNDVAQLREMSFVFADTCKVRHYLDKVRETSNIPICDIVDDCGASLFELLRNSME